MADQQLEDNKIPVRKYLRKHYIQSEIYKAICRHCSSIIFYRRSFMKLFVHLKRIHSEVLTEKQYSDHNIYWEWDYYTPIICGRAMCNICYKIKNSIHKTTLARHLNIHRKKYTIFNPKPNIDMSGSSSSASSSMTVKDASITIASNLTDNMDRSGVPNESATKTSESTEHIMDPLEDIENIRNIEKELPVELELCDTEEVPGREELPDMEKHNTWPVISFPNFYSPDLWRSRAATSCQYLLHIKAMPFVLTKQCL